MGRMRTRGAAEIGRDCLSPVSPNRVMALALLGPTCS
jgi:hypothetical protein